MCVAEQWLSSASTDIHLYFSIQVNINIRNRSLALHWRHNDHDGVSNHQPHHCLLILLFRVMSRKTSKFRVTGLCVGNSPEPVNSPHKGPVTRKMFPFDDVIMDIPYSNGNNLLLWSCLNSLAPGKLEWNFRHVIFKQILVIGWGIFSEIALIWMSLDSTNDQSTLVQVMAWCRQATNHYLSQCWPRSLLPYIRSH